MIDIALVAELDLDPEKLDALRAMKLDASGFAWPEGAPLFTGESPGIFPTVGKLLDAVERAFREARDTHAFFEWHGRKIRAFFTPELTAAFHQDVATALRLAGKLGAKGEARWFVPVERVALIMPITPSGASGVKDPKKKKGEAPAAPEWCPQDVGLGDEKVAQAMFDIFEWATRKRQDSGLTRDAFLAEKATFGLGPMNETHEELLAAVADVDAPTLQKAIEATNGPDLEPLSATWPTAAAAGLAIAAKAPLARVVGVSLLARFAPAKAEPLAMRLADDPSPHVRTAATRALALVGTDAALDKLVSLLDTPSGDYAGEALVASKAPGANARVLALLDGPALAPATWAKLERRTDARRDAAELARRTLHAVGRRNPKGAVARLLAIWAEHPAEEVRKEAARAAVFTQAAEVAEKEQELVFTLMGMGKALNADDARRRALLKITEADSGGILKFEALDAETFVTLVEEGFLDPNGTQNESPSAGQFHSLMVQHPEILGHGYVVSAKRSDYRVTLEGITCDLGKVPKERKKHVLGIFKELRKEATNGETSGNNLHLWWT